MKVSLNFRVASRLVWAPVRCGQMSHAQAGKTVNENLFPVHKLWTPRNCGSGIMAEPLVPGSSACILIFSKCGSAERFSSANTLIHNKNTP